MCSLPRRSVRVSAESVYPRARRPTGGRGVRGWRVGGGTGPDGTTAPPTRTRVSGRPTGTPISAGGRGRGGARPSGPGDRSGASTLCHGATCDARQDSSPRPPGRSLRRPLPPSPSGCGLGGDGGSVGLRRHRWGGPVFPGARGTAPPVPIDNPSQSSSPPCEKDPSRRFSHGPSAEVGTKTPLLPRSRGLFVPSNRRMPGAPRAVAAAVAPERSA